MKARTAQISTPTTAPTKKPARPWPPWRLGSNVKSASDERLDEASDSGVRWEWGCAALVIIGVAGEAAVAFAHPPYDSRWAIWGPIVGDLMVAIGVAGEVLFSMLVHRFQAELLHRSDEKLTAVVVANSELQAKLAPRALSVQQAEQITAGVKQFAGMPFGIATYGPGTEAYDFAEKILSVLLNAGWEFVPVDGGRFDTFIGVVANMTVNLNNTGDDQEGERAAGEALVSALREAGVPTRACPPMHIARLTKRAAMYVGIGEKA